MFFSVIIPLYNRPDEIRELLQSLCEQTYKNFEVVVVEDGSSIPSEEIVNSFKSKIPQLHYFFKPNSGPGPSRNFGMEKAKGDFYIIFDSDCVIPNKYFENVNQYLKTYKIDLYGGPDAAHPDFSDMQKAVSHSMTSLFTTGGIRGKKNHVGVFHPRSFNLGMSAEVFEKTNGFSEMRYGEDIDFSIRAIAMGFKSALIPEAFVYHKRRTNLKQFFNQVKHSGEARIDLYKRHKNELKLVHFFPSFFTIYLFSIPLVFAIMPFLGLWAFSGFLIYLLAVFIESLINYKSINVAFLSILTSITQLTGYGIGFIEKFFFKIVFKN
jgi:glycosyltransferase involved in cell wall biosynthesis